MIARCERYTAGVERIIAANGLDWSVGRLGARAEYRFVRPAPRNGTESAAGRRTSSSRTTCTCTSLNRDILLTPFHNMALMCPTTTDADVDLHLDVLDAAVTSLAGRR